MYLSYYFLLIDKDLSKNFLDRNHAVCVCVCLTITLKRGHVFDRGGGTLEGLEREIGKKKWCNYITNSRNKSK